MAHIEEGTPYGSGKKYKGQRTIPLHCLHAGPLKGQEQEMPRTGLTQARLLELGAD